MANVNTPDDLLHCPITFELFRDPVVAQDGRTYEREAIEQWIQIDGTSPFTRQPLSIEQLRPNYVVKEVVDVFETLLRQKHYQFTLDIDVRRKRGRPLFEAFGKTISEAEWIVDNNSRPAIVLLRINGARAKKEASFYVDLSRHPHIIRTFGFVYDSNNPDQNNTVLLLQEYAFEGNLYQLLQERRTAPDEKILIQIFLQIIEAMICLTSNHVIHGDLACRNVLVFRFDENRPERNVVKITDFGLSRHSQLYSRTPGAARTTLDIVPVRYAAPEVLLSNTTPEVYTEKSDVYSMGVLMWEAYSRGAFPWGNIENDSDVIRQITSGNLLSQPSNCSQSVWSIITKTWSMLPRDRPTFSELKHLLSEQYYRSGGMLQINSGGYATSIEYNLNESNRREALRQQEERNRNIFQRQQEERDRQMARQQQEEERERDRKVARQQQEEERDRKVARQQQEEEDRKIAQQYALLEKRRGEERVKSAVRTEQSTLPIQNNKLLYSNKQLQCKGRACAKCGDCRDWYWRPRGKYGKNYIKRSDATCSIDGHRRIDSAGSSDVFYGCDGGGNGGSRISEGGPGDPFYYHIGYRPHGSYGNGRLCACDDNCS